jgi:hypothetical protein
MKETFNNVHELYDHDEERILEYRIINACITGNLETIQNYCERKHNCSQFTIELTYVIISASKISFFYYL